MRMNTNDKLTAFDVVNGYTKDELVRIFRDYGEEKWADRIAEFILNEQSEIRVNFMRRVGWFEGLFEKESCGKWERDTREIREVVSRIHEGWKLCESVTAQTVFLVHC